MIDFAGNFCDQIKPIYSQSRSINFVNQEPILEMSRTELETLDCRKSALKIGQELQRLKRFLNSIKGGAEANNKKQEFIML